MVGQSTPEAIKILVYDNYIYAGLRTTENHQSGRVPAYLLLPPKPVTDPPKAQVWGLSVGRIVASISSGGMEVCVL
jgi:hypothetical protein